LQTKSQKLRLKLKGAMVIEDILAKIRLFREGKVTFFKGLITAMYVAGLVGMMIPDIRPLFQWLTPFHLLANLGILLLFHDEWTKKFLTFMAFAFLVGFGSEVMGVHTGFPFGNYIYGPVLGIQLWEVPLMIGVNWLLLVYVTGTIASRISSRVIPAALIGAGLMVFVDFFIEPVASPLDFWTWENDVIPTSNFVGWFGVALIIHLVYQRLTVFQANPVALHLFLNLTLFFLILNFTL
jgi:uncharacterized membrane protein